MEVLLNGNETLQWWLLNYGGLTLFFFLALGMLAVPVPVPDETLMVLSGTLMYTGHLPILSTLFFAFVGPICGITLSYLLGRTAGYYFLHRFSRWLKITEKHLQKAHDWFEHYGKWALVVGYFIPGVRHLTGFCAGTTYLQYSHFALFAYSGAILWVSVFLGMGYAFSDYFLLLFSKIAFKSQFILIPLIGILIVYFFYRWKKTH